ncbi:MAG: TetR/AcrR family transcriptional regulator [Desulfatibacillaceae bacterium]
MKPSPRQAKHTKKLNKALKVAARLFAKKGYEKVSIEEIAWKLNLTKGSLYHYFKSKEEVLYLIQKDAIENGIAAQTRVLESDKPPPAKLADAIRTHVTIVTKSEVAGALNQQELILPPALRASVIDARDRYENIFQEIISQGVEAGVFQARDVNIATISTLSLLNGIAKWYSPGGANSLGEITEAVTEYILKGLAPRSRKRTSTRLTSKDAVEETDQVLNP